MSVAFPLSSYGKEERMGLIVRVIKKNIFYNQLRMRFCNTPKLFNWPGFETDNKLSKDKRIIKDKSPSVWFLFCDVILDLSKYEHLEFLLQTRTALRDDDDGARKLFA